MEKYVVFHIEGGLGKNIAATAVVKSISEKYKDRRLIVIASHPEIFLNNPYVYRIYRLGSTPYFWDDFIKDKDTIILRRDPYLEHSHISDKDHLIKSWHIAYELEYDKDKNLPELYTNMIQRSLGDLWVREKPIMLINSHGGGMTDDRIMYSWTRDIPYPLLVNIVEEFGNKYHILQVCKNEYQSIDHPAVEPLFNPMSNFELFSLLHVAEKRVLIDSALQHAAAAFKLSSLVLWIGTSVDIFGYDLHTNIIANKPPNNLKLPDSEYFKYQLDGVVHECPYTSPNEIFDNKNIIEKIKLV